MVDKPLQGVADRATDSDAFEYAARAGFAVSGVLHVLIAYIILRMAFGSGGNGYERDARPEALRAVHAPMSCGIQDSSERPLRVRVPDVAAGEDTGRGPARPYLVIVAKKGRNDLSSSETGS